jgi:hypothetical protein
MPESASEFERVSKARLGAGAAALLVAALVAAALFAPAPALAGQASTGELFFYPCTNCHPVTLVAGTQQTSHPLPNDFKGHKIVLIGHDKLGKGDAACLACHDDPSRDPGKLKLADGSLVDIKGDIAQVCYRCHSAKYKEFKAGTHGKRKPSCVAAGCHDPHTPGWIYAEPLTPFLGNGFQFKVLPERQPFTPLPPPAPAPRLITPWWFAIWAALGLVAAGWLAGGLVAGRLKR